MFDQSGFFKSSSRTDRPPKLVDETTKTFFVLRDYVTVQVFYN